jgi:HNH endonuclease
MDMLTADRLRELMAYHPETGTFTFLVRRSSRALAGMHVAGSLNAIGYFQLLVDHRKYAAHRLAWLWMTGAGPKGEIDHRNGDRGDNRWANLRDVTRRQNNLNRQGDVGASFDKTRNKWTARIGSRHLGRFPTREEALAARRAALPDEFARMH